MSRLWLVDDDAPAEAVMLLAEAARERRVAIEHVRAVAYDWVVRPAAEPGDAVVRLATTPLARQVERAVWRPGVTTVHRHPAGVMWDPGDRAELLALAGVAQPARWRCATRNRARLRDGVAFLGGLPVVLRMPLDDGETSAVRVDSWPSLHGLVDHLVGAGEAPELVAHVERAVHWRVIVVGGRSVAAYRHRRVRDDLRGVADDDPADYAPRAPDPLEQLSVAAAHAIGVDVAGVDVLVVDDHDVSVLDVHSPVAFAQAEQVAGIPVARAILAHLLTP